MRAATAERVHAAAAEMRAATVERVHAAATDNMRRAEEHIRHKKEKEELRDSRQTHGAREAKPQEEAATKTVMMVAEMVMTTAAIYIKLLLQA